MKIKADEIRNGTPAKAGTFTFYKVRGSGIYEIQSDAPWADDGALKFREDETAVLADIFSSLKEVFAVQNQAETEQKRAK